MNNDTESTAHMHAPEPDDPALASRRRFLSAITIALSGAMGALMGLPVVGFLLAPLLRKPPLNWQRVGAVDGFKVGETVKVTLTDPSPLPWAGVAARTAAWLRRDSEERFVAFSVNCTHLGCPVRWLQDAGIFMCPCHGGVFYKDGSVAAGPPPHPLNQYRVQVRDGQVEVLTESVRVAG